MLTWSFDPVLIDFGFIDVGTSWNRSKTGSSSKVKTLKLIQYTIRIGSGWTGSGPVRTGSEIWYELDDVWIAWCEYEIFFYMIEKI